MLGVGGVEQMLGLKGAREQRGEQRVERVEAGDEDHWERT